MPAQSKPVRLRPSPTQRTIFAAIAVIAVVLSIAQFWWHLRTGARVLPFFYAGLFCVGSWQLSWFGVDLTPDELVVNNLRRRRIPWSQIQAITAETVPAGLGALRAVVWTSNGTRIPLRAPVTSFPRSRGRFQRQFAQLGDCWLEHRGPDLQPQYALPTETGVTTTPVPAGWWLRAGALVTDFLLISAVTIALDFAGAGPPWIWFILWLVYSTLLIGSSRGQTVGDMASNIRVIDATSGNPIGRPRALLRTVVFLALQVTANSLVVLLPNSVPVRPTSLAKTPTTAPDLLTAKKNRPL